MTPIQMSVSRKFLQRPNKREKVSIFKKSPSSKEASREWLMSNEQNPTHPSLPSTIEKDLSESPNVKKPKRP